MGIEWRAKFGERLREDFSTTATVIRPREERKMPIGSRRVYTRIF